MTITPGNGAIYMEETTKTTDEVKATETAAPAIAEPTAVELSSKKKMRFNIKPGMTVKVHQKIREITPKGEEKERVQIFEGIVLGIRGAGASKTFMVRKESNGIGVEKIFPMDLPTIVNVEPVRQAKVKRAKLYNLKDYTKKLKEKSLV
jgi:large subunit ribosomal protein L19